MSICLDWAQECGVDSEARLQLAEAAFGCLTSNGRLLLAAAGGSGGMPALQGAELAAQLRLVVVALVALDFTAEMAAEAAAPAPLAAWMASAAGHLRALGEDGRAGGSATPDLCLPMCAAQLGCPPEGCEC